MGALERARVARRGRLGGGRSSATCAPASGGARDEATWRWRPTSPRTPRSWASRCSCSRRSPGPRSCSSPRPRPTSAAFPACTRRRATRASPAGPRRRGPTRTGRPSWRSTPATTRCEPGYASFVEALGAGVLRRPRPLRRAHRRGGAARTEATGATASRPTSTASSRAAGSTRRSRSPRSPSPPRERSATPTGSPTRSGSPGMAFSKADARRAFAAWDEGVAFVREHRVQFFEGFLARDAARLHTSDGEPEAALVLFADAIAAFHRAGNVPQLIITLASVPALFERLDRLGAGGDAPRRAVARAVELPPRSRARRPRRPASRRKLGDDARRGARWRRARRSTSATRPSTPASRSTPPAATRARGPRQARPGGPEPPRGRGAAPRRRRPDRRRDRDAAVHLGEDRRAPHPAHLHEDRRLQPGRGDPLGRQARGRRR